MLESSFYLEFKSSFILYKHFGSAPGISQSKCAASSPAQAGGTLTGSPCMPAGLHPSCRTLPGFPACEAPPTLSGHRHRQDRGTPLPFPRRVNYWWECWLPEELNHPLTQTGALCPTGEHYSSGTRGTRLCVRGESGPHFPRSETHKSSLLEFQLFG